MENSCENIREQIPEFLTGSLLAESVAQLRAHIDECSDCTEYLKALEADEEQLVEFTETMRPIVARLENSVIDALGGGPPDEKLHTVPAWSRIVRSRIGKTAAAAVIIAGLMLIIFRGNGGIATPAFARMAEAMGRVTWMHKLTTRRVRNPGSREEWVLFDSSRRATLAFAKAAGGGLSCKDYANGLETFYDPTTDTKVITYRPEFGNVWWRPAPESLVEKWKSRFENDGTEVTHETGKYEGHDADFYCSTDYDTTDEGSRYVVSEFRLIVDRHRHLPLATEFRFWLSDGTPDADEDTQYSYPEEGPKDVYELGCPKTARVVDNSPSPELLQAVAGYRAGREGFPSRYIAVLVSGKYEASSEFYLIDGVELHHCDDYLQRCDLAFFRQLTEQQFTEAAGNSFESIVDWWNDDGKARFEISHERISLYSEERCCWLHRAGSGGNWRILYDGYSSRKDSIGPKTLGKYVVYRDILAELGWTDRLLISTRGSWKISLVENDYSRENNLVCIEVVGDKSSLAGDDLPSGGSLFYLDPQHDYICRRYELYPRTNSTYFREVLEYGRTDSGHWYPKKIFSKWEGRDENDVRSEHMVTVYLNTDAEFPEDVFSPESLPTAGK